MACERLRIWGLTWPPDSVCAQATKDIAVAAATKQEASAIRISREYIANNPTIEINGALRVNASGSDLSPLAHHDCDPRRHGSYSSERVHRICRPRKDQSLAIYSHPGRC